ncbi:GDP-L-fucose synthase family protein [Cecembia rubra]|uniref:GDP-L-fucose synthase n=1 Tax=Cecembia rubra TaxID=1485585 RepID=A0A2P8EAW4_9BACT|nr:GDP-L-fucose synthase [Cecembia rubra]PSL06609.1 GDP-L-fucose synthase [Cecembia rubra]
MLSKETKIYVAGHRGMVGSAIFRLLVKNGYRNVIGLESSELDLRNQQDVNVFFNENQPEVVIDAAARVGGILANSKYPYQFLMENLQIQNNLIDFSLKCGVKKFIFLGSSCIYPKMSQQPIKEEYLLNGFLEPTNEAYAISKIAGVKACEAVKKQYGLDYISLMPTNLYGPYDNFDLQSSHVLPAMIRKFHEAKEKKNITVELWGSGNPMREFLHVDDLAEAVIFSMENELKESLYNVGTGTDISIKELAKLIQQITGHKGDIKWDTTKPDGTPRKLLDISKLKNEGWESRIDLESGILSTFNWFIDNLKDIKEVKLNF